MNRGIRKLFANLWPEYSDPWRAWVSFIAGITAIVAGLITFIGMVVHPNPKGSASARLALIMWTIVPPVYFWFEYFVLWKGTRTESLEEIKYDQEVCRNIWLAFVVLIAALYFK